MKRSYSLIFMTDQGKTSRMRMGSGALRFFIILLISLPLLLAGTLWAGWELLQRYSALRDENASLRTQLEEQRNIIARLGSLEDFLRVADPELLQHVLGPSYTETSVPAAVEESVEKDASRDGSADTLDASPKNTEDIKGDSAPSPEENVVPEPSSAPVKQEVETEKTTSQDVSLPEEKAAEPESVKPNLPLRTETNTADVDTGAKAAEVGKPTEVDKGLADVRNMKARRVGARNLRISLDLYNTAQGKQLAGDVDFELILADGTVYPLTGGGNTSYRINRLKKIISNPTLPNGVELVDGAMVRAKVYADNELIYSTSMPLQEQ
ncbi:MAG TPA: hypothetical protein H9768_06105 [Candidatus Mailhella merdavium]|nr:hypothetical protein [Candidatus Mailhella merdavium]